MLKRLFAPLLRRIFGITKPHYMLDIEPETPLSPELKATLAQHHDTLHSLGLAHIGDFIVWRVNRFVNSYWSVPGDDIALIIIIAAGRSIERDPPKEHWIEASTPYMVNGEIEGLITRRLSDINSPIRHLQTYDESSGIQMALDLDPDTPIPDVIETQRRRIHDTGITPATPAPDEVRDWLAKYDREIVEVLAGVLT